MPDNTNTQRSLLMLWLMLLTNSDIFEPPTGGTLSVTSVLNNLTGIEGIDDIKTQLVTDALSEGYADSFTSLRQLYQNFSKKPLFWPPRDGDRTGPDHPTLADLEETFFRPAVGDTDGDA